MKPINIEIIDSFNYLIKYVKTIDTNDINQMIKLLNDIENIKELLNSHIVEISSQYYNHEEICEENAENKMDFVSAIDELNKERQTKEKNIVNIN